VIGAGTYTDEINHSPLGDHRLPRQALFGQYAHEVSEDLHIDTGIRIETSDWGTVTSPVIGFRKDVTSRWSMRGSVGHAFRTPSFTELYYNSPANMGDPDLKPEEAICYEAGFDFKREGYKASVTLFDRDQIRMIDWIGATDTGPWQAENVEDVQIYGLEGALTRTYQTWNTSLTYTWTGSNGADEYISKYALRFPEHQISGEISGTIINGLTGSLSLVYKQRVDEGGYHIVSGNLSKKISDYRIFISASNVMDREYEDISGVPQPGRWVGLGVEWKP